MRKVLIAVTLMASSGLAVASTSEQGLSTFSVGSYAATNVQVEQDFKTSVPNISFGFDTASLNFGAELTDVELDEVTGEWVPVVTAAVRCMASAACKGAVQGVGLWLGEKIGEGLYDRYNP